jgi:hypothetical protein
MHKYILAIQNLLVVICISYKPCITKFNIIKKIKKTKKNVYFFASCFCKVEPALLEEIIISLDFVAKCGVFFECVVGNFPTNKNWCAYCFKPP